MSARKRSTSRPAAVERRLEIESLDLEARGIARDDGKVVFVHGALPGEHVRARRLRSKPRYDLAEAVVIERESSQRVRPACPHFGVCGGCSMQHLHPAAQLAVKQRVLEDQFARIAGLRPELILRPVTGPSWGYRFRARLSVRHVPKKGGVLVGFRERNSSYVADMSQCLVLPPEVSALLLPLRALVGSLTLRERIPQIEVAVGDFESPGAARTIALVFRILDSLADEDLELLRAFSARAGIEIWLQPRGPDSIQLLARAGRRVASDDESRLAYSLPEFDVRMPYRPTDFTQVNHAINTVLVSVALRLLRPGPDDRVVDFFCGLGNFSLPLARRSHAVIGIEGSAALVARAADNARANALAGRTEFRQADLFRFESAHWDELGAVDLALIDPPREGASALAQVLAQTAQRPRRIVYVSCNPATLARDAAILVHQGGWRLAAAGVLDMFAQTSHIESIAVFEPAAGAGPASRVGAVPAMTA